jgi:molybdopterin molybdotransferase
MFPLFVMNGSSSSSPNADVRMRGFAHRVTVREALDWVDRHVHPLPAEECSLCHAAGHVLAADIQSSVDVPGFDRAMMDGFALRAAETHGASIYNPLPFTIVADILPGTASGVEVQAGQAARIMTGAPLPAGADAVLPVERTRVEGNRVWAQGEVPPEKNVGRRGEDIQAGQCVLQCGRRLRPQDLGILSSIGCAQLAVVRSPSVRIVITGNELLPSGQRPSGSRIVDANGPMLTALVERDGGVVIDHCLVPDDPDHILQAMRDTADVVLISGGSSVGMEDHAPRLLATHGELAIHGIAMRPSSPSGMGHIENHLVFLLPGNPVSCLCSYDFFAGRALRTLAGRPPDWPYASCRLPLRRKLVSQIGRVDYARVIVRDGQVEPLAISGASVLSSTSLADGFVILQDDCEGFPAGTEIEVFRYDN